MNKTVKILILLLIFSDILFAQKDTLENAKDNAQRIEQLSNTIQDLETQNAVLTKSVDMITIIFSIFAALIGFVLIAGTITSMFSWNTDRKRSNETYNLVKSKEVQTNQREQLIFARQDEMYSIALTKDEESSKRDKKIFGQSEETLRLVNETLKLAKDASERASRALEDKLAKKHYELEQESIDLIDESRAFKNYKILVEDSNFRSNLMTLSQEISGLQNNQNILEKDVALLPYCSFIRGMEFHINQHFKTAIKYWTQTKEHPSVTLPLKVMSLYWIAYEQNNLKDFDRATSNFELASELAQGALKYELERIKIESKFFDSKKYEPESLLAEMVDLYDRISKEAESEDIKKYKSAIALTLGNIYHELGNTNDGKKAEEYYILAKKTFFESPIKTKWTWFGYGESCFQLGEIEEAESIFLNEVKAEAEFDYSTRPEPRTKVLGQTTVLICSVRVKSLNESVNTLHNLIKTTLGGVDERLTVYSQFQRRNVEKKEYMSDLENFIRKYNETKLGS